MTRQVSKSGFTLLEILVASMLMAMLVTILTMVFNSSSIAWSTGKSSVAEMNAVRRTMSVANRVADNAVPRVDRSSVNEWGYLVSPWEPKQDHKLRPRGIVKMKDDKVAKKIWDMMQMDLKSPGKETGAGTWTRDTGKKLWAHINPGDVNAPDNAKAFVVGVWSWGPDGQPDTDDDICTWPDVE